mmetsp:Transcript_4454/g.11712  ORF Transcript_4454/g.11712 Transcript_4454/m.11712 type:complete len:410 (-) Transcript_4454:1728-2957(-)
MDHHVVGRDQKLWFLSPKHAPGAPFFNPSGAHIYNKLVEMMRQANFEHGYDEVMSPQLLNAELFARSGHVEYYASDMFLFDHDGERMGLKPMSCPCHCLIFSHSHRSYRELPLRFAEFGVCHRNECSGSLSGLRRVRRFCQDDAHIFCAFEQIEQEVLAAIRLQRDIYQRLGLAAEMQLGSRPAKALGGNNEQWEQAEEILAKVLQSEAGEKWSMDIGGGAFYGPKIDFKVCDARGIALQCASIQLDFQMPRKFELSYVDANGKEQVPVMIHRAILGSIERMMSVLCEHYQGAWPFWLSPHQALVLPVSPADDEQCAFARRVQFLLRSAGVAAAVDLASRPLRAKIKDACSAGHCRFCYVLVVGREELESASVSVKESGASWSRKVPLDELVAFFARVAADSQGSQASA